MNINYFKKIIFTKTFELETQKKELFRFIINSLHKK